MVNEADTAPSACINAACNGKYLWMDGRDYLFQPWHVSASFPPSAQCFQYSPSVGLVGFSGGTLIKT